MKKETLNWLWTDLITPFKKWNWLDNKIDFNSLDSLLERQIDAKIDWLVLLWTNSEFFSLTKKEMLELVKYIIKKVEWKIKIMVSLWANSTLQSIKMLKKYEKISWINWYLIFSPSFILPTQFWLYSHFKAISKKTEKLIILNNSSLRAWIDLEINTVLKIIEDCENVVWIKFDDWDLRQEKEFIKKLPTNFSIFSWDDKTAFDLIQNWWNSLVSTASNIIPSKMKDFIDLCIKQDKRAKDLNKYYDNFFEKLNLQISPIPTKTFLANNDFIKPEFRLPLCRMDLNEKEEFLKVVEKYEF